MIYEGIDDMPQAVWRKIGKAEKKYEESKDKKDYKAILQLLFITPQKVKRKDRERLEARLEKIKDQYFEEILLDDDLETKILKHVKREILRTELLIENDNYKMTMFMKIDMELKAMEKNIDNSDKKYFQNKAILTKYMGGNHIDENKVSVREFDSWFRLMVQEYEALEMQRIHKNKIH